MKTAGYQEQNIPSAPLAEGAKIEDDELPNIGIWIMPDNSSAGKIETFLKKIVADDQIDLWEFAEECIEKFRNFYSKTKIRKRLKFTHIWLGKKIPEFQWERQFKLNVFNQTEPKQKVLLNG